MEYYQEEQTVEVKAPEASVPELVNEPMRFSPDYYMPVKSRKKKNGMKVFKILLSSLLILALVVGSNIATAWYITAWSNQKIDELEEKLNKYYTATSKSDAQLREEMQDISTNDGTTIVLPDGEVFEGALSPAQVYAMNVNAVVAISNQGLTTNIFGQTSETASSGTGFVISEDGYIISNYHVVAGATKLSVITADGGEYNARLVGYDETNDISVLKIEANGLKHVLMGSSDALVTGDQVAAIGNPLGELTSTLTVGYISAKDRIVNTDGTAMNMLQTDAAINSGNSGGPLFNMRGEVIGITTSKYTGTSASGATIEGIGFAIPIDDVKDIVEDLLNFGYIKSGYLGVMVQDVAEADSQRYGLPLGALVLEVTAGTCAEKAGIQNSDIIVDIGGHKITSINDLTRALRAFEGGEETVITVYRSGKEIALPAILDSKPQS